MKYRLGIILIFAFTLNVLSHENEKVINIQNDRQAIVALGGELSSIRGMLEAYAKVGIGSNYKMLNPKKEIESNLKLLDNLLNNLKTRYNEDEVILSSIQRAENSWAPVKKTLEEILEKDLDVNTIKEKTKFIHDNIRGTLKEIEKMKNHIVSNSGLKDVKELNAIIEIGASARRISAHYMMKILEVDDDTIEDHYKKGLTIYEESLQILRSSNLAKDQKFEKN